MKSSSHCPFNVREFGAIGDGQNDDTSAIQQAIDAAGEINGGNHYNITGNFFDRSGGPGIWLRRRDDAVCDRFAITGNVIRRSGAFFRELQKHADSQVRFEGGCGIVFTGNTLSVGQDDDGKGRWSPASGIVYGNMMHSVIKDNVLHQGALHELVVDLGGNEHGGDRPRQPGQHLLTTVANGIGRTGRGWKGQKGGWQTHVSVLHLHS